MDLSLIPVLGVLAVVLSVVGSWPQAVRLLRGGTADGVPLSGALMGALCCTSWFTYGVFRSDETQLVNNALCGVTAVLILGSVVRHTRPQLQVPVLAAAAWIALTILAGVVLGAGAVGALCTAISLVQKLPQVREVFVAPSLAGLSPASCALGLAACTSWFLYGAAVGDLAVLLTSGIAGVLSAVVLWRRCPAPRVIRHLLAGRWGRPGVLIARPMAAFAG